MEEFIYARSFRDLFVYKQAFIAARKVFEPSKMFPEDEKYALTSQIRRASRSIGGRLLQGMMDKADSFCSSSRVAEDTPAMDDPLALDW